MDGLSSVLRQRRRELGLTLAQVADQMGVTEATVQRWESGNIKNVRYDKLDRLAEVLHVDPRAIMGWDDILPPTKADPPDLETEDGRFKEFIRLFQQLTGSEQILVIAQIKGILAERRKEPET